MLCFVFLNQVLFLLGAVFIDSHPSCSLFTAQKGGLGVTISCLVIVASQLALHFTVFLVKRKCFKLGSRSRHVWKSCLFWKGQVYVYVCVFTEKRYKHSASLKKQIL